MAIDAKDGPGRFYDALLDGGNSLPYDFPRILSPGETAQSLPEITEADLRELKRGGWARLGIVAALVSEDGRLLMLRHRSSDKTREGEWGPLAETSAAAFDGVGWQVEHTAETVHRAIKEELGVDDPSVLDLKAQPIASWALHAWPVGGEYSGQHAFAVCPTVVIPSEIADWINEANETGNVQTAEISGAMFVAPERVPELGRLREGALSWLHGMKLSGAIDKVLQSPEPLSLPPSRVSPGWQDVIFDDMNL